MMRKIKFSLMVSVLCLCVSELAYAETAKPIVFVSIVPQKYFVQQISRDLVDVEAMVRPGASPATYEPKPSQMAKLSSCTAYFAIGVPFERAWLGKIRAVNPKMKIVQTDRDITKIGMVAHLHEALQEEHQEKEEYHGEEYHGEEESSDNTILDPHIWLSPGLVKKQAAVILEGLIAVIPEHGATLTANYHDFLKKIDVLDLLLKQSLKEKKGMRFMVFHPSWGYFAKEYGLEQIPIEIEGKSPKPAQLGALIHHAREKDIRIVFVQPQFSLKSAKVVAREINGKAIIADPLAEDWFENLKDVALKFNLAAK